MVKSYVVVGFSGKGNFDRDAHQPRQLVVVQGWSNLGDAMNCYCHMSVSYCYYYSDFSLLVCNVEVKRDAHSQHINC